jgi:UPF0716 protein FxsA
VFFLLLIFLLPAIEIYLFIKVVGQFGFINTLFALLAAGVLGAGIAKAQGRYMLMKMQGSLAQGQVPAKEVLHGLLIFVGGVLFLIPGFATDVAALVFVVPGLRHMLAAFLKRKLEKQIKSGQFRFTYGQFGGFGGGFRTRPEPPGASGDWERDVSPKVIDVSPISSETVKKPENQDG